MDSVAFKSLLSLDPLAETEAMLTMPEWLPSFKRTPSRLCMLFMPGKPAAPSSAFDLSKQCVREGLLLRRMLYLLPPKVKDLCLDLRNHQITGSPQYSAKEYLQIKASHLPLVFI